MNVFLCGIALLVIITSVALVWEFVMRYGRVNARWLKGKVRK